jgi:glycyl-tRNA synthetase
MFGLANRGNFDLTQHQEHSKSKFEFFDENTKTKLLPHVIEPSLGVDRFFMAVLFEAYNYDKKRENTVLKVTPKLAPKKVAVFPLMKKDELLKVSRKIYEDLLDEDIEAIHDSAGSVGKRYARQDEVGTPYCITVDYEAIEEGKDKGTVTIRDRDTTKQVRIKFEDVVSKIKDLIKGKIEFSKLN